jgi:RimJ/RimL family protein N-acetyltransferase
VVALSGRLEGQLVAIRPLRPDEWEAVWHARTALGPELQPTIPDRQLVRRRVQRSGTMVGREIDLGIESGSRLVGEIQTHAAPGRGLPDGAYELGIVIHDPADRGKGFGTEAIALLTSWLFEQVGATIVQASTETGNVVMRRTLEKLGFAAEARIRELGREHVLYAIAKAEWATTGPTEN